jgi:glycosyltransferase involved in cell wall biosynthesis
LLHLPPDVPLILFGAMGGVRDPRKGFDLLQDALNHLRGSLDSLELVVFGQRAPEVELDICFPIHFTGHLHDDVSLRLLYSAADVIAVPSRQDNFPNAGIEAHACGTPVVAFNATGLSDIVAHLQTGYLAKAFDTVDLAAGLAWVLADVDRLAKLGAASRERAVSLWSSKVIAKQYLQVYRNAFEARLG